MFMITKPTDRQTFEGEIATCWFDEGILFKQGVLRIL